MKTNYTHRFDFVLGERRKVFFDVLGEDGSEEFVIADATWKLEKGNDLVLESEGNCTIEGKTVICTIQPEANGYYLLTVSCTIGDEIIKGTVTIQVDRKRG